jgi:signal transduction histidine kinase
MLDIKTLIFGMGLGNLTLALMVWTYASTLRVPNPHLARWQLAKLVCGVGYLMSWGRPLLPTWLQPLDLVGNLVQFAGFALELIAYCGFLGLSHWRARIALTLPAAMLAVLAARALLPGPHLTIVAGSILAGSIYAAMAWVILTNAQKDRRLLRVLGFFDAQLALLLIGKGLLGLFAFDLVRYAPTPINFALYGCALVAMLSNGFGFLLLVKHDDDKALQQVLQEQTEAVAQQRQFIAMLSHEVRSPLAVIDSAAQVLEARLGPHHAHMDLVGRIRRGSIRLAHFFDNSLTQERIDSKSFALRPTPVDMAEQAVWARETALNLTSRHLVELVLEAGPVRVQGDATMLRIALMNLLTNAIKYAPADTVVTLHLRHQTGEVRIEVHDQGPGVPADERLLIFQKFQRGRSTQGKPGAGLGLAVVQHIVALHGGRVWVEGEPGEGARFCIELPAAGRTAPCSAT